ncbi:MAG: hypothetical protein NXH91_00435 [Phyllobacteriaceae bacterium]|jgi:hypothetical protein|nr:hypothetical protein [Phyllobacteriaceae bacterium]
MMFRNALTFGALMIGLALAGPVHAGDTVELASESCFAIGQNLAARQGATLVGAEAAQQNGRNGCRVVLLYQGQGGERPRREEIFVAQ